MKKKRLAVLGSTGSIGKQTLEVAAAHPDRFEVTVLTARSNVAELVAQARRFLPKIVVLEDATAARTAEEALADLPITVLSGVEGLLEAACFPEVDMVLTALVGFAGLAPTLSAIAAGKDIALANKETMVVAGEMVQRMARENCVQILPVDSEHSAIFQCLAGESQASVDKLILTASGGPFRGYTAAQLKDVSLAQALKHPNWSMGNKITIDSATMVNKALEIIEARWLFDIPAERIEVVVHPQSIIHSLVAFVDGSLKAQLGLPDMRLPIQYALAYPDRLPNAFPRCDLALLGALTFEAVDVSVFRSIAYAYEVMRRAGNSPCILNAANEEAVAAFLQEKIRFLDIYNGIEFALNRVAHVPTPNLTDLQETDRETRRQVDAYFRN